MGEQGRSEEIRGGREIRRDRALQLARLEPHHGNRSAATSPSTPPPVKTICFPVGFSAFREPLFGSLTSVLNTG